ncbi:MULTISPECIES: MFS transporter [unclassified Methylobacterium]|uniref:MFS transporter n=1 Tax=unclassified Methylobacterium TaxID=2615210 RepID=UPI00226A324F|nr:MULTISPECIES: MFS transporter [unclassified Methylobacterium]
MLSQEERRKKLGDVLRVASGNFLEQYDFFVYGYYASYIGKTFFPADNAGVSLMLSLATFSVGFFMRPLGAIILGSYIDRHGRRKGLLLTLGLMAAGTLSIAITPSYETLGILAPIIILTGRLLQGFSAGAELGGVSIYLAEIATPGRRGFYTSWQSASQQPAVVFAALIGVTLSAMLTTEQMTAWGWRIPLLIGCAIIPLILFLRRSLTETEEFQKMKHAFSATEVLRIVAENWRIVLTGAGMSVLTTTTFYLITAYTPTFGREALHLDATGVLIVTLCVGISNFIWLPIGGHISDRIGRYPLLLLIPVLAILTAYPVMNWLADAPSFPKLLATVLLFSSYFGLYNGAMIPTLSEIMPARVRTAGFSLAFSLATALFGGLTPLVSTALIQQTGNRAAPALWLTFAAVVSLSAVILSRRTVTAPEGAAALS